MPKKRVTPASKITVKKRKRSTLLKRHSRYFVYIVECVTGTYYTGYTKDLDKRIKLHNSGHGAKYLRGKLPVTLVFKKEYKYYKNALSGEREVKRLSRKQKEKLVAGFNRIPAATAMLIFLLAAIVYGPIPADAETLHLKSGKTITAPILEYADDHIKVDRGGVTLTYYKDEIESISVDPAKPSGIPGDTVKKSSDSVGQLIEKVSRSVVLIEARKDSTHRVEGTGFFISSDGLVVTNLHVIFKTTAVTVKTKDGTSYPAKFIVNSNADLDLCVLKIDIASAPALPLGDSDSLSPGQIIFTIGHREGSRYQTSSGPYVGKRMIDGEENLQSKFVSGHGNSGGPILDTHGKIVGISKAFSPDIGHNFGIPINAAKPFLNSDNPVTVADFNNHISEAVELAYSGQGLLLAGKYGEALNYFKQALTLEPQNLKALIGRAKAYTYMFMDNEAFTAWEEVTMLDPENTPAHVRLGKICLNRGMTDRGLAHLEKAAELAPQTSEIYSDLGFAYGQKGMLNEAIKAYKKAIEFNPSDADSHYNLAVAYFNKHDFTAANEYCEKAKDLGYAVPPSFLTELEQSKKFGNIFQIK